jgi:NCS1 family nucleobase:cation symporter-1
MTFSPSSYNLGASLVSIGLLWWHGMIAAVIGSAILTVLVVLNSRGAIKYFIGFPVYVRAAAGVRGASLYILVRAVVAIIYFATQVCITLRYSKLYARYTDKTRDLLWRTHHVSLHARHIWQWIS